MTLVSVLLGNSLWAAPENPAPQTPAHQEEVSPIPAKSLEDENLSFTAPDSSTTPENWHAPKPKTGQSLGFRLGMLLNPQEESKSEKISELAGFQYLFPGHRYPRCEVGVDLTNLSRALIHVSARWVLFPGNSLEPYTRLGVTHDVKPSLATVGNIDNYLLRGGVGFEDALSPRTSVRLEGEFLIGLHDTAGLITLGYSWPW
jgi:hypothetical protein